MDEYYGGGDKEPSFKDKIDKIYSTIESGDKKIIKKLKIPRRAKVSKSRMKKGWVGFLFINEANNIRGEKTKVDGGTYVLKDGNTRYTNGKELIWWEGKHPIFFQRYDKANPENLFNPAPINQVYGQDQIKARMKKDIIKPTGKGGMSILYIIAIVVGGYFIVKTFFPKLFGG